MALVAGEYYDASSSRRRDATLEFEPGGACRLCWQDADGTTGERRALLGELQFSERLGHVPRQVTFADGAVFATADNDAIDEALRQSGRGPGIVARLEAHWPVALGSVIAVTLITVLFLRFGVPALANVAARTLPPNADRMIGAQSLDVLDRVFFGASRLPAQRQQQLRARFADMTRNLAGGHDYRLEFRAGGKIGPNALALPSGIVVVTDELVELAQHDEELVAVMAHEIGHVRGRHALRQLLQTAGVSAMAVAILGDVSSVSALVTAVPAAIQAKHSRDFEREADAFAQQWLQQHGIAQRRFDDILCRMERAAGGGGADIEFLRTHPATDERARCR